MNEARENIMQAIAEYLEMLYFDECPEEWEDRPAMHDVETQIKQALDILKEVSFTIPENKFVVITGPNGGGKSTIAKA